MRHTLAICFSSFNDVLLPNFLCCVPPQMKCQRTKNNHKSLQKCEELFHLTMNNKWILSKPYGAPTVHFDFRPALALMFQSKINLGQNKCETCDKQKSLWNNSGLINLQLVILVLTDLNSIFQVSVLTENRLVQKNSKLCAERMN